VAREAGYPLSGPDGLLADLERTARTGFAIERGRNDKLIASVSQAVAGPKGPPLCALTIVGPDTEFDEPRLSELTALLSAAAGELRGALTTL
jgi:IclR family acetate operon transcriptional repressor